MGYKNSDPCIQKALEDERLFVLMTRDNAAPETVCEWIKLSIRNQPPEKLHEALDCALEMVRRNVEIIHKKNSVVIPEIERWESALTPGTKEDRNT